MANVLIKPEVAAKQIADAINNNAVGLSIKERKAYYEAITDIFSVFNGFPQKENVTQWVTSNPFKGT